MNPLLETIVRDLAQAAPKSALPWAPVVPDTAPRTGPVRRGTAAALRALARRVDPHGARIVVSGVATAR